MWVKKAICNICGKLISVRKTDNTLMSHKVKNEKCLGRQGKDYKYYSNLGDKMKKTKIKSEAQKAASERNWNKGKVIGMVTMTQRIYDSKITTREEQKSLELIKNHLNKILKNWVK